MTDFTTQPPRPQSIGGQGAHIPFEGLQQPYPGFMPHFGLFGSVGGVMTRPCRVMLNCETGQLLAGASDKPAGSALDPMPVTVNRAASDEERAAALAWIDHLLTVDPSEQPVESADAQHALIAVKDGQAFQLLCFGPITEGPEREALGFLMGLAQRPN